MMAARTSHVANWKKETVDDLTEQIKQYPVIGIVDMSELPARQFQQIRQKLRDQASIIVTKNTLLDIIFDRAAENNPKLVELKGQIRGQSGVILSKINPFKLNKFLKENKVNASARPGSKSPRDIVIPAGDTDLPPGPAVGELQRVGLKARIQAGKVVVLEDHKIVKEGDVITKEISDTLAKFGIMPLELGLKLRAAFEDGLLFTASVLSIDEKQVLAEVQGAGSSAFNLAFNITYPTKSNVGLFLSQATFFSKNLAINARVTVKGVMPELLSIAQSEMLALARVIGAKNEQALSAKLKETIGAAAAAAPAPAPAAAPAEEKAKAEEKPDEKKEEEAIGGLGALFG